MSSSNLTVISLKIKVESAASFLRSIPGFAGKTTIDHEWESDDPHVRYVWNRLAILGIYNDAESHELLMFDCPEGEARRVFCENGEPNIPPVRFRKIWSVLTGKESAEVSEQNQSVAKSLETVVSAMRPIQQWKDVELIDQYGLDCDQQVIEELERRCSGRRFVVFSDENAGIVDKDATLRMLREARRRQTPVSYTVGDSLKRLYGVGDFPHIMYDVCPVHGCGLYDDYCDESKLSWQDVSMECRILAHIAVHETREMSKSIPDVRQFILAARAGSFEQLRRDYPHAALVYDDLAREGNLPNLRARSDGQPMRSSSGVQDPFVRGNRRV